MSRLSAIAVLLSSLLVTSMASAQTVGTFRWQFDPYCNVVTLAVTRTAAVLTVDGTDDQCGATETASANGTAFFNPDGSIGLGLDIGSAQSGIPVHVDASISVSTLSGTWHDSNGNTGALTFTPGPAHSGNPRPRSGTGYIRGSAERRSLAIGVSALENVGADVFDNTAFGALALRNTTTGADNTAIGVGALQRNVEGQGNTAVGRYALGNVPTGNFNVAIGWSALPFSTGARNIAVGANAGSSGGGVPATGSDNIYIGASVFDAAESDTTRIGSRTGNDARRVFVAGIYGRTTGYYAVPVVVDLEGQLGTISSSRRVKQDIDDLGTVAVDLQKLRPVSFRYTKAFADGTKPVQYGLIAEEVAEVLPQIVAFDGDGQPETVMYQVLPTLLLAEVQRLERERSAMVRENADLRERVERLERLLVIK